MQARASEAESEPQPKCAPGKSHPDAQKSLSLLAYSSLSPLFSTCCSLIWTAGKESTHPTSFPFRFFLSFWPTASAITFSPLLSSLFLLPSFFHACVCVCVCIEWQLYWPLLMFITSFSWLTLSWTDANKYRVRLWHCLFSFLFISLSLSFCVRQVFLFKYSLTTIKCYLFNIHICLLHNSMWPIRLNTQCVRDASTLSHLLILFKSGQINRGNSGINFVPFYSSPYVFLFNYTLSLFSLARCSLDLTASHIAQHTDTFTCTEKERESNVLFHCTTPLFLAYCNTCTHSHHWQHH